MQPEVIFAGSDPLLEMSVDDKGLNIVIKKVGSDEPPFLVMGPAVGLLIAALRRLQPLLRHLPRPTAPRETGSLCFAGRLMDITRQWRDGARLLC